MLMRYSMNRMNKILPILILIFLQACATPAYQAYSSGKNWSGGAGYAEQNLGDNKYLVQYTFLVNQDFRMHYLSRRALELCPEGFKMSDVSYPEEELVVIGCGRWVGPNQATASAVVECLPK
jgi:hypothetical protein